MVERGRLSAVVQIVGLEVAEDTSFADRFGAAAAEHNDAGAAGHEALVVGAMIDLDDRSSAVEGYRVHLG